MKAILPMILLIGAFLRFFGLPSQMPFFQDVGWFYISARNIWLYHQIPLVGITSSHTWLHQGALWTYLLAIILKIFNFNPAIPAYFIAIMGVVTIYLVYHVAKNMFDEKTGIFAAFFYATSPLIIEDSKIPYHTSLIPFFTALLIYFVWKWIVEKKSTFFPLIMVALGALYNQEIATFTLFVCVGLFFAYGVLKKKDYIMILLNTKTILLSILGFIIPMAPMLIYDIHHGFPQTVKFVVWVFYRIAVILGYHGLHPEVSGENWHTFIPFTVNVFRDIIFQLNWAVALLLLSATVLAVLFILLKKWRARDENRTLVIIFIFLTVPIGSYILQKTNSAAYLLMFYPQIAIAIALLFSLMMENKRLFYPTILGFAALCVINSHTSLKGGYFSYITYHQREVSAKRIVSEAKGRKFNIVGKGYGSQYESFLTNYEYFTWYYGNSPSREDQNLKYYVSEDTGNIKVVAK